jgi:hypothetical protein
LEASASVCLADVVDVPGLDLVVGESFEDSAVVSERADGLARAVESPEGGDSDRVGEVVEGYALAVELDGEPPVVA